jgi:hypothetical protein
LNGHDGNAEIENRAAWGNLPEGRREDLTAEGAEGAERKKIK